MIILHEGLYLEASHIAKTLEKALSIRSSLREDDLTSLFEPIPEFNGFWHSCNRISQHFYESTKRKKVLVLTSKDIYFSNKSKDDDYCFGYDQDDPPKTCVVVSTARLKGTDDRPRQELEVMQEIYLKRLSVIALHEIGHEIVKGNHLKEAIWVNSETGYSIPTDVHCPNNGCVLYQVSEIQTPPPEKGYIKVGDEKRFDTGLDDLISRLTPDFFCEDCRNSMTINEKYR